jgi:hypothetical protein
LRWRPTQIAEWRRSERNAFVNADTLNDRALHDSRLRAHRSRCLRKACGCTRERKRGDENRKSFIESHTSPFAQSAARFADRAELSAKRLKTGPAFAPKPPRFYSHFAAANRRIL